MDTPCNPKRSPLSEMTCPASSTAVLSLLPVPRRIASNSALESASGPSDKSRSRGLSSGGSCLMVYLRGPTVVFYIIQVSVRCRLRHHACLGQRLVQSLVGHVSLRGKVQVATLLLLDFGQFLQPRVGFLIWVPEHGSRTFGVLLAIVDRTRTMPARLQFVLGNGPNCVLCIARSVRS
jgi:hypothetical protein